MNHAILKLRYPLSYDPFTDLYFPEYPLEMHEWAKEYLRLLLSLFPPQYKPNIYLPRSLNIQNLHALGHLYKHQFWYYIDVA